MLTIPTEIQNNKDKIYHKVLALFDIPELKFRVGSKKVLLELNSGNDGSVDLLIDDKVFKSLTGNFVTLGIKANDVIIISGNSYTVNSVSSETELITNESISTDGNNQQWSIKSYFLDKIKNSTNISINESLNELINSFISSNSMTIDLIDWDYLKTNLIGSNPDLRGKKVNFYFKYDSNDDKLSSALLVFTGQITNYSSFKKEMKIVCKTINEIDTKLPKLSLVDNEPDAIKNSQNSNWGIPIQFGEFGYFENPIYYADKTTDKYAICLFAGVNSNTGKSKWVLSDREFDLVPSATYLMNNLYDNQFIFQLIGGKYVGFSRSIMSDMVVTNNPTDGCFLEFTHREDVDGNPLGDAMIIPYSEYSITDPNWDNRVTNYQNSIDGDASTYSIVNSSEYILNVWKFDYQHLTEVNYSNPNNVVCTAIVSLRNITLNSGDTATLYLRNGSTILKQLSLTTSNANSIISLTTDVGAGFNDTVDAQYLNIAIKTTGSTASIEVKNIVATIECKLLKRSDNQYLFVRSRGQEYSSSWNGRKAAGNSIMNPIDIIEALLRDYGSITNINESSFDEISSLFSTIKCSSTIFNLKDFGDYLNDLCKNFGVSLIRSASGKWSITAPNNSRNFTSSGLGSPNNSDLFTENETLNQSNEFNENIILYDTFKISRSNKNDIFDKITIQHTKLFETYFSNKSSGSGDKDLILKNDHIGSQTEAQQLLNIIANWFKKQKFIIEFKSSMGSIAFESGDIVNIRSNNLTDQMLSSLVNDQKWLIFYLSKNYDKLIFNFKAIEL